MSTETAPKTQKELPGMPKRTGVAKLAYEWVERQAKINQLEYKQGVLSDEIIKALKKENRQVLKVQDPTTKEFREFKIDPGHDKLRVRKVPEKVGKNK